ncbi:MAG: polysaccharide biosynthesis/export family protein [Deltaproteobacteria bacterium]|nr:polysaccharide biosynthesis/export family protein [Deltaproteobacteria bacterium]
MQSRALQCGRILRVAAAVIAGVAAAAAIGCATPTPSPAVDVPVSYRVGAPDGLRISILPEPAIEVDAVVRPDGMITIPLIGDVAAGNRTISEITAEIEERIARYKRDPHVNVALAAAASTDIVVLGEVRRPSSFPLVKETRVVEAIGLVGGTTEYGSDSYIRVIRTEDGETKVIRVNLNAIRRGDLSTNLMLIPGDFVYVPPTLWARFGYALNALLMPFQPVMGLGMSAASRAIFP